MNRVLKYWKNYFELKYWKPGDTVILENLEFSLLYRASFANEGREPIGTILSFSTKEACIQLLNKEQWYIDLVNLINVTAQARKRKNRIEEHMDKTFPPNPEIVNYLEQQKNNKVIILDLMKLSNIELEKIMNVFAECDNFEIATTIKNILHSRNTEIVS